MIEELSYNLPGYGFAKCYIMGQAIDLMNLLSGAGLIEKMQGTCQLGTMKYVYPGAHHTRYEYVFTQLLLISNVVSVENVRYGVDFSQTSNLREYEDLGEVSGGTVMQCLAILSNAGHMYDTFTSSRILLQLLVESRERKTNFYRIYRRNLPRDVQGSFDSFLDSQNFYKLHLFNMLHILQGLNRSEKGKQLCQLCTLLITQLIDPRLIKYESTTRVFELYKKIRKIAYLSVDMIYTPASFGANLNRMIYSIPSYVDDLFDESSVMNKSIQQLEDVIHHQIYNAPTSILNTARIIQDKYEQYQRAAEGVTTIFQIRDLILEKGEYGELRSTSQPKALKGLLHKSTLLLSRPDSEHVLSAEQEKTLLDRLPLSRIAFGSQVTQNMMTDYYAFGLLTKNNITRDTQIVIARSIEYRLFDESEKINFIKLAVQSLYEYDKYFFNFSSPHGINLESCVVIGQGCKKVAQDIRNRFTSDNVPDGDQLHEILSCANVLDMISYAGVVICFVGGIKASKYQKSEKIDELDGFIYFPNREAKNHFAYIVEAKNYIHGEHEAQRQLETTKKFLSKDLTMDIKPGVKCAYMAISLKN